VLATGIILPRGGWRRRELRRALAGATCSLSVLVHHCGLCCPLSPPIAPWRLRARADDLSRETVAGVARTGRCCHSARLPGSAGARKPSGRQVDGAYPTFTLVRGSVPKQGNGFRNNPGCDGVHNAWMTSKRSAPPASAEREYIRQPTIDCNIRVVLQQHGECTRATHGFTNSLLGIFSLLRSFVPALSARIARFRHNS